MNNIVYLLKSKTLQQWDMAALRSSKFKRIPICVNTVVMLSTLSMFPTDNTYIICGLVTQAKMNIA
jgi:hypothetical protein